VSNPIHPGELSAELRALISDVAASDLYAKSRGAEVGMSEEEFTGLVQGIAAKYLLVGAKEKDVRTFLLGLRVEDLALARACAAGNERAWEIFLTRFREKLYDVAAYIARESSAARELADSIYANLYGLSNREGERVSKLASYTGRGSLEGWLRTVLAQEYVNRYRKQRRLVSLEEESEEGVQFAAAEVVSEPVSDPRLEAATDEVLASIPAEDRFVLASYYLDRRTLADIARTLQVHESTISRKLDKLAKVLRKNILAALIRRGMSRRQAQEAMEVDVRDLQVNIRRHLTQESAAPAFSKSKAGTRTDESPE
jgi:RNA polymerase sigma-70 factor (ECF subfamily)